MTRAVAALLFGRWQLLRCACAALTLVFGLGATPTARAAEETEKLIVTDPYIELRTGPGRGYPIFFVAARDERIQILLRHTDWYKVRTEQGKEGWVIRSQLETTLTEAGSKKTFRDSALDD